MDLLTPANRALRRYLNLCGISSRERSVDGTRVHYYELKGRGAGAPVVLVHGLGGSANGWYRLFGRLAKRFSRVIALDLPGNGFSPIPDAGLLSNASQVTLLRGFLSTVVKEPAFLVGTSLGGAMCLVLTQESPELIRALALIAPAGAVMTEEKLHALFSALDVRTTEQARALTHRLFHRAPLSLRLLSSQLRHLYGSPAVRAFVQEVKATDFLTPEVLRAVTVPTLLLWGGSEKLLPAEGVDYFRAHLPAHAEIRVMEGFGHVPQVERPGELANALIRFADGARL